MGGLRKSKLLLLSQLKRALACGSKEDAHKWSYSENMLFFELQEAGFKASGRILEGKDSKPWLLNVISAKSAEAIHKIQNI